MRSELGGAGVRLGRYSPAYRRRLVEAGAVLHRFLVDKGLSNQCLLEWSNRKLDSLLETFVSHMHDQKDRSKRSLVVAKHAVLFAQVLRPRARHQLKGTWSFWKAWEESVPSQLRAPLPIGLLIAMCCRARISAATADTALQRGKWYAFSALLGAGFFGLLRPGELLNLKKKDVGLPNQLAFGRPCVTLQITKPKNFRQLGHQQFVVITQPDVCNWLTWLFHVTKTNDDLLWRSSATEFRRLFKSCCLQLWGKNHPFVPASLRAGGATFKFDECADINRLRLEGRWSNVQSLEHYIQVAKAQQLSQHTDSKHLNRIITFIRKGFFLLALPKFLSCELEPETVLPHGTGVFKDGEQLWKLCRQWGAVDEEVQTSCDTRWVPKGGQI